MAKSIGFLLAAVLLSGTLLSQQSFGVTAYDRYKGIINNLTRYKLTVVNLHPITADATTVLFEPYGTFEFHRKDYQDIELEFFYAFEDYDRQFTIDSSNFMSAVDLLEKKGSDLGIKLKLGGDLLHYYHKEGRSGLLFDLNEFLRLLDSDYRILANLLLTQYRRRVEETLRLWQATNAFYEAHRQHTVQRPGILSMMKLSPNYKSYNPQILASMSWGIFDKTALNEDWGKPMKKASWQIKAMLGITPEWRYGTGVYGRLYAEGVYERISFGLNKQHIYAAQPILLTEPGDEPERFTSLDQINLCVKNAGAGLVLATNFRFLRIDLSGGLSFSQTAFLTFDGKGQYVGSGLRTKRFDQVAKSQGLAPYGSINLIMPFKNFLQTSQWYLSAGFNYRQLKLRADKGTGLLFATEKTDGDTPANSYLPADSRLPTSRSIFDVHLGVGLFFNGRAR